MWLTMWLALLLRYNYEDENDDDGDNDGDDDDVGKDGSCIAGDCDKVDDDNDDDDDDNDDRIERSLGDRREAVGAVALASGRVPLIFHRHHLVIWEGCMQKGRVGSF